MKRNQEILKILKSNEYFYLNKELILKKIKKIEKSYKIIKIKKERNSEKVLQLLLMSIMIFFFPSILEIMLNPVDIENIKNIAYLEYFFKACPYIGGFMFIIYFISLPFSETLPALKMLRISQARVLSFVNQDPDCFEKHSVCLDFSTL